MAQREIPSKRKAAHYLGLGLIAISILSFIIHMSSKSFEAPIFGFVCFYGGLFLWIYARVGLSGTGLIIDPERERKDLEPWNRSKGRQLNDMLEETQLDEVLKSSLASKTIIKVRCQNCEYLNDEADKFCGGCGGKLVKT